MAEAMAVGKAITCVPDFDRVVVRARDDLRSVVIEADGVDVAAVRVLLLRLELKRGCQARGEGVRGEARAVGVRSTAHLRPRL